MSDSRLRVLLTGPGGRIGPHVVPHLAERFDLTLLDQNPLPQFPEVPSVVADLSDIATLTAAMDGVDVVIHLAATSDEAPFVEQLVPNNVVGMFNVLEAARAAKVRRLVFASTVQTVGFFPPGHTVQATDLPRPVSLYGCTKVLGETMGRHYHYRHGLEFVAVRIGWFQDYDSPALRRSRGARHIWLSPRDCANILERCASTPGLGDALLFATSKTDPEYLSRAPMRELLGYEPVDDVADIPVEENPT